MTFSRVNLVLLLLVGLFHATHSVAQSRENIVLLPIEVSPEYANQENLIGIALQQSLNKNFNVFYGDSVEAALQAEYAKEDCSAETCVQNIAILFNGEIIVDASVQRVENSAFLSVQFRNVITGELEAVVQDACRECSFTQLIDFIDERVSDIALNSSQGLTALLEKQAKPLTSSVATPQREQPKPSVTVSQEPINPRPKVAKSSSYWKWGLGALALGAGGGGGGGSGSGASSNGTSSNGDVTAFSQPGVEWIDVANMITEPQGFTYVRPQVGRHTFYELKYNYGGQGNPPQIANANMASEQEVDEANNVFQFETLREEISRFSVNNDRDSDMGPNFDIAAGATIIEWIPEMTHLSYFSNNDGDEFLGLFARSDNIARAFFGVAEEQDLNGFDRVAVAYHGGQAAPDNVVPTGGQGLFRGHSAGQWISPSDVGYWTTSDIEVSVDFSGTSSQLTSSNTMKSSNPASPQSWSEQFELDFDVEGGLLSSPKRIGATSTNAPGDMLPILSDNGQATGGAWSAFFYHETLANEVSGSFTFFKDDGNRDAKYIGAIGATLVPE